MLNQMLKVGLMEILWTMLEKHWEQLTAGLEVQGQEQGWCQVSEWTVDRHIERFPIIKNSEALAAHLVVEEQNI